MDMETYQFKKHALKAAKDLFYGEEVIEKIRQAETIAEIDRILNNARKTSLS